MTASKLLLTERNSRKLSTPSFRCLTLSDSIKPIIWRNSWIADIVLQGLRMSFRTELGDELDLPVNGADEL